MPSRRLSTSPSPLRLVITVGISIGLCIVGDSLLYGILPLEAANLGISLPLVGVLLSANRLVRLGSNTWASGVYERMGPRRPFIASTLLGLTATILYGVGWGFGVFLAARILWGIAWSGLRQGGFQAVWSGSSDVKGRLMGIQWGVVRTGSALAVLGGGFLYDRFGYTTAVGAIALVTVLAVPVAWSLKWPELPLKSVAAAPPKESNFRKGMGDFVAGWQLAWQAPTRRWLTAAGFMEPLLHGVVIGTTSLFLAGKFGDGDALLPLGMGIGTITGLMLGTRWIIDLLLGPSFGFVSDRLGQANMAAVLVTTMAVALVAVAMVPAMWAVASLLVVFICDGGLYVVLNATASGVATESARPHLFVGIYTTASDAGSALGPLLAFSIGSALGFSTLYVICGVLLATVVLRFWYVTKESGDAIPSTTTP